MYFKYWLDINETHYTDYYGNEFLKFRKKYNKLKKNTDLYVQFSNYDSDVLNRQAFATPSHNDPVGVYSYPLAYVIDYPADIWYGTNSKYLRVLKIKNHNNKVSLQNMEPWFARNLIEKAGLNSSSLYDSQKAFKHTKGAGQIGKQFFQAVQHNLEISPIKNNSIWGKKEIYTLRTGLEQTALLRKMGIEILIDNARTPNQAVINNREPNQAVFLTPTCFEVLEIFEINSNTKHTSTSRTSVLGNKLARKLASMIAKRLNDQIITRNDKHGDTSLIQHYFTKSGREIKIEYSLPSWYMSNRKMGEKKHKEFKYSDVYEPTVYLAGERGESRLKFSSAATFDEIAKEIVDYYLTKNPIENFKPHSIEDHKKKEEELNTANTEKRRKTYEIEAQERENRYRPEIQDALDRIGINLKLTTDKMWYFNLSTFHRLASTQNISEEELEKSIDDIIDKAWKVYNILAEKRPQVFFLKSNDSDSKKFIEFYKLLLLKTNIQNLNGIPIPEIMSLK